MTAGRNIIGRNLKQLREAAGLSREQVADFLRVDPDLLSGMESGERPIGSSLLTQLSTLFCFPVSAILSDEPITPMLNLSYRANAIGIEEMKGLAIVHKLVMNVMVMDKLERRLNND